MKNEAKGVYQLENGNWGYRYGVVINGKTVWRKKTRDSKGHVMKTKSAAVKERDKSITALIKKGEQQNILLFARIIWVFGTKAS